MSSPVVDRARQALSQTRQDRENEAFRNALAELRRGDVQAAKQALTPLDESAVTLAAMALSGLRSTELAPEQLASLIEPMTARFAEFGTDADWSKAVSDGFFFWWLGRVGHAFAPEQLAAIAQSTRFGARILGRLAEQSAQAGDTRVTRLYVDDALKWGHKSERGAALATLGLVLRAAATTEVERELAEETLTQAVDAAHAPPLIQSGFDEAEALAGVVLRFALGGPGEARPNARALSADHRRVTGAMSRLAQLGKTRSHKDSRSYGILEAVIACARRAQHDRDRAWFDHGATLAARLHSEHLKLAARIWLANAAETIGGDLAAQASAEFLTQDVSPEALRGEAMSALASASFAEREAVLERFEASSDAQAVLSGIRVRARWGQDVAPLLRTLEARMEPSSQRTVLEYANGTRSGDDINTHQDADAARDARELLCELGELPRALALARGWGDVVPLARHGRTDDDARAIFRRLGELVPLAWAYSEAMFIIEPLAEHGASIEALDLGYEQALRVRASERALSLSALVAAFAARGDETRALRCIDRALERPAEVLWTDDDRRSERVMALAAAGLIDRAWTEWLQILDAPMQRSTPAMAALERTLARVGRARADELVAQIIERLLAADHKLLKGESYIRGLPTNAGLLARGLGHASPELAERLEDRLIDHWVAKRDESALGRFLEERVPLFARDRRDALLARAFPEHFLNREQYLVACHAAVRIDTTWPLEQIVDHLQNSSDDARITAVDALARAGRERDALALGETCAQVGSQARALLGVARYGSAPELRPEIEKRAKKLPKGKLTVPLQASLHENRAALALHFGGVEVAAFDLALKSVLASRKDRHGRRGPNLPGMVRLSELVERHPGAFRDDQLVSLTRGFIGLQPERYFLQALPAIFHGARESARPELERAVAEHTEKRPKGYRTEAALGLALGLARVGEMKARATEAMSQALEFAREDASWTVAPWLEAIARNLPKEEASDLMLRLASIAASTDGRSLGAIYERLLARGRGRAMIDFMRTARMARAVQQKVVWDCVQTALHAAPDPVDELLAWFDVLPEDASLTNARVEWLWLALLQTGRVEEAEQLALLLPEG